MLEIEAFDEYDEQDADQVPMRFEVKITATGEVRDVEGNLLNVVPIEHTVVMTEEELHRYLDSVKEST